MPSIPSPTIMRLDPNDENIILSIPEDSGPLVKENTATLTPKKVDLKSPVKPGICYLLIITKNYLLLWFSFHIW